MIAGNAAAQEAQPRLAQVVYITMSKACSCTLERCQAGDVVVGNVFNGKGKDLLRRIDYSTDKETARDYMKKYGLPKRRLCFSWMPGGTCWGWRWEN